MQARKSFIGLVCLCAFVNGALAQQASSLDMTFNPGTGANFPLYSVALATNGDVLIGGAFTLVNGQSRNHPRSVKYMRARKKQIPECQGEVLLLRGWKSLKFGAKSPKV
jgi:hypothetical protein